MSLGVSVVSVNQIVTLDRKSQDKASQIVRRDNSDRFALLPAGSDAVRANSSP